MSMEEREDPTKLDEDVEGHVGRTRDAVEEDTEDDVEGHVGRTRDAQDDGDDVEGHSRTR